MKYLNIIRRKFPGGIINDGKEAVTTRRRKKMRQKPTRKEKKRISFLSSLVIDESVKRFFSLSSFIKNGQLNYVISPLELLS
jgi:hypothetical protein